MGEMKYYWFVFCDYRISQSIRIKSKRKPSAKTIPRSGTWVLQVYNINRKTGECKWVMPCIPEITWGRLSHMKFIRKELP